MYKVVFNHDIYVNVVMYTHYIYIYIYIFPPMAFVLLLSCLDTLIVWCIYIYIDVQALIIK